MRSYLYRRHLDEGEEIHDIAYRHWLILKKKVWQPFTFALIPPVVIMFFLPYLWPLLLIWFLVGVTWYILKFFEWYYDCLLITNVGIIDIERRGVFDNTSKRIEYHMIDGVSYTIQGFVPTLLNYGDLVIDKLGAGMQINLQDAGNPRRVDRSIMKYQEKFLKSKSYTDHEALKGMLAEMIANHAQKGGGKSKQ
ncbi:hypothetical protein HOE67_04915 [Candidatus Peregrinibacteria bacterium]|jgi:hypothetical protein|nr:hypothetical protein [Candidatus Peregrinibacteria bacterium]MBT4056422.1 hypothetical protein [Candidatus Peregrinibacteria bacterium]